MICGLSFAQESLPCQAECVDTETEMREFGVGKGETILEATVGAVSNALGRIKKRIGQTYPDYEFTYITTSKSTNEGELVEVETTLGQPNIICNEVQQPESDYHIVYIALSIDVSAIRKSEE